MKKNLIYFISRGFFAWTFLKKLACCASRGFAYINLDLKLMPLTPGLNVYLAKPDELAQYIYVKSLVTYTKQYRRNNTLIFLAMEFSLWLVLFFKNKYENKLYKKSKKQK